MDNQQEVRFVCGEVVMSLEEFTRLHWRIVELETQLHFANAGFDAIELAIRNVRGK